jgi:hypothetical protein
MVAGHYCYNIKWEKETVTNHATALPVLCMMSHGVMHLHKLLLMLLKMWAMMSLEQTDVMFRGVAKPIYEGYVFKKT